MYNLAVRLAQTWNKYIYIQLPYNLYMQHHHHSMWLTPDQVLNAAGIIITIE